MRHARTTFTVLRFLAFLAVAVVVACVVVLVSIDFNTYRALIEEQAEKALERDVVIEGDLHLSVLPALSLTADGISLANAPWSDRPVMARAGRLAIDMKLAPLLHGTVEVDRIVLSDLDLSLEVDAKGRRNWDLVGGDHDQSSKMTVGPLVGAVRLERAQIHYHDGRDATDFTLSLDSLALERERPETPVNVRFAADWNGRPIDGAGHLGRFEAWLGDEAPLSVVLDVAAFDADGRLTGTVARGGDGATTLDLAATVDTPNAAISLRSLAEAVPSIDAEDWPVAGQAHIGGRLRGPLDAFDVDDLDATLERPDGTRLTAKGRVADVLSTAGFDLAVVIEGRELADLLASLAIDTPPTLGPYRVSGRLGGRPDKLSLTDIEATAGSNGPLRLRGGGTIADLERLRGLDLVLEGTGSALPAALDLVRIWVPEVTAWPRLPSGPFTARSRLVGPWAAPKLDDIVLRLDDPGLGWQVTVRGAVDDLDAGRGYGLAITTDAEDAAKVADAVGLGEAPALPLHATATVTDRAESLLVDDLNMQLGSSDLVGRLEVDRGGARPRITGRLASVLIDWDVLFPPQPETDSAAPLLSSDPFVFDALRGFDAEIALRTGQMVLRDWLFADVEGRLRLEKGVLTVAPLALSLADGRVDGSFTLDAARPVPSVLLSLTGRQLALRQLLTEERAGTAAASVDARVDIAVDLAGQGRSPHDVAAVLNGSLQMVGRDGRLNNETLAVVGRGVTEYLPWTANDDANRLNCLAAHFDVETGLANSRILLLDTNGLTFRGDGHIDLGQETVDIIMVPKAKKISLARLALPVAIRGRLAEPTVSTDVGEAAIGTLSGTVGVVEGIVTTPLDLLGGLIGLESKKRIEDPCRAVLGGAPAGTGLQPAGEAKGQGGVEGVVRGIGNAIGRVLGGGREKPAEKE